MVQETCVSFEIAKKLKEAGFPQENEKNEDYFTAEGEVISCNDKTYDMTVDYLRPTIGLVAEWFLTTYNLIIVVGASFNRGGAVSRIFEGYQAYVDKGENTNDNIHLVETKYQDNKDAWLSGIDKAIGLIN